MEKGSAHPIRKKTLDTHLVKVDEILEKVPRGMGNYESLFDLVKGIGTSSPNLMSKEANDTMEILRQGFSLFYEMNLMLSLKADKINSGVDESEKTTFVNAYAMFASSSFIENKLDQLLGEVEANPFNPEGIEFKFGLQRDELLQSVVSKYYALMNIAKAKNVFESGIDLPRASINYFRHIRDKAISLRSTFKPDLVALVDGVNFIVADEFSLTGFEKSHEEKTKVKGPDYIPVEPHEIAGNVRAKTELLRDMDRLSLYDPELKKNPVSEVGGLSYSVICVGLPGTGKSKLVVASRTRMDKRCGQINEFRAQKNLGKLIYAFNSVTPRVKDRYYGGTGANMYTLIDQLARADRINGLLFDDIDLLMPGDRDKNQGADNDILTIMMQAMSGTDTTVKARGNSQIIAATNEPTKLEKALLQRFFANYEVEGPIEWYDFADILFNNLGGWVKKGIVLAQPGKGYTPFEMRKGQSGRETSKNDSSFLSSIKSKIKGDMTFRDLGELCAEMKRKNPRFTGRPIDAVSEAVKKRINDYDIPEEWFEKPEVFIFQPYEKRVSLLVDRCQHVPGNVIAEEIERYVATQEQYEKDRFERDVEKEVYGLKVRDEALKRFATEHGGQK